MRLCVFRHTVLQHLPVQAASAVMHVLHERGKNISFLHHHNESNELAAEGERKGQKQRAEGGEEGKRWSRRGNVERGGKYK